MRLRRLFLNLGMIVAVLAAAFVSSGSAVRAAGETTTPIKHVVVIFQENISFDHYFGTYPNAMNPAGEPAFYPAPGTPSVNGLSGPLLTNNPNSAPPYRIGRANVTTCDQDHNYKEEQQAYDYGKADKFVEYTGKGGTAATRSRSWPTTMATWSPACGTTLRTSP